MSHVECCKVAFKDIAAVKAACEAMGLTFVEGKKHWSWWGSHAGDYPISDEMKEAGVTASNLGQCDHVIQVPGTSWEVGLWAMKNKPGSYMPLYDFYGSQGLPLQKALCKQVPVSREFPRGLSVGLEKLADAYSLEVLKSKARMKGWQFQTAVVNGVTKLTVKVPN